MPKDLKSSTNEHEAGVDALAERISKLLHNSIDGYEISSPNAKESSTCSLSSSKVHSSSLNSTSTSGLGSNIGTFQRKEGIWRDNLLWDLDSSNNDKEYSSENIGDEEDKNQSFSKAVSRKYFSGDANLISPEKKTDLSGLNEFCHPKMPNFTQNILIRKPFNPSLHHKFSRKVFVGGLPGDASEADISISFACFGLNSVDWPYRRLDGSCYPPKGYCFILFNSELSVRKLIDCCIKEKNSYYWRLSSPTINNKMVQIRPWVTSDSEFVTPDLLVQCGIQDSEAVNSNTSTKTTCISLESGKQLSKKLHPRKMIFVGGIPRPTKALDLALSLQDNFGKILYAAIDTDSDFHYPKGAGKVLFESRESYIRAIKERFVEISGLRKRIELKPYLLENQPCDICGIIPRNSNSDMFNCEIVQQQMIFNSTAAQYCSQEITFDLPEEQKNVTSTIFCASIDCLHYYCQNCWLKHHHSINDDANASSHRPLLKDAYGSFLAGHEINPFKMVELWQRIPSLKPIHKRGFDDIRQTKNQKDLKTKQMDGLYYEMNLE